MTLPKIKFIIYLILTGVFISGCVSSNAVNLEDKYPIIPIPKEIRFGDQELHFEDINIESSSFENEAKLVVEFFKTKGIPISENGLKIQLIKENSSVDNNNNNNNNDEAYTLSISDKIVIAAHTDKGIYYGIQSLKQIFRKKMKKGFYLKWR